MPHTWPHPPELDAMVADPEHHTVLFENEQVRVIDTKIPVGGQTKVHTHCWPGVLHIVTAGDFLRFDPDGNLLYDSRTHPTDSGAMVWGDTLPPHFLKNIGTTDIHVIGVELKQT